VGSKRPTAEILAVETTVQFEEAVRRAAELLRRGEVVALPTETVYGLAANAFNPEAVARIFDLKGRPSENPIIVHVAGLDLAKQCAAVWPETASKLSAAFWPGPLTIVLPRSRAIPDLVTGHGPTVGIRWPSHPLMQAVIRLCGFPLAAPSANKSGRTSPTTAEHVQKDFNGNIPLIVDGGAAHIGIESTVIDLSVSPARVLRPGQIHRESLAAVVELEKARAEAQAKEAQENILRSPGMLAKHYAPKARVVVLQWSNERDLKRQLATFRATAENTHVLSYAEIPTGRGWGRVSVIPHDPDAYARAFYAELHRCDELGAGLIVIEALPETEPWEALRDRIRRAAA